MRLNDRGEPQTAGEPPAWFLLRRPLRYYKSAFLLGALGAAATVFALKRTQQGYRSETVILYRAGVGQGDAVDPRRTGARLQDMIMSRERLQRVVEEFRLFPDNTPMQAIDLVRQKVTFKVRDGSTFTISFAANSPELARDVTKRLADSLIQDSARQRAEEANKTKRFFETEQRRLEKEQTGREEALSQFVKEHPEVMVGPEEQQGAVAAGETFALEMQLAGLQDRRRAEREARSRTPTSAAVLSDPGAARTEAEAIAALRSAEQEHARASAVFDSAKQSLTEANPDFVMTREQARKAEARLAEAREKVEALSAPKRKAAVAEPGAARAGGPAVAAAAPTGEGEAAPLAADPGKPGAATEPGAAGAAEPGKDGAAEPGTAGVVAPAKAAGSPPADADGNEDPAVVLLRKRIAEVRKLSTVRRVPRRSPHLDLQFQNLRRALDETRQRLAGLEEQKFRAQLAANFESSSETGQMSIMDPANLPGQPEVNNKRKVALIGLAGTLILALGVAFLRAITDDRLYDRADVTWLTSVPLLAVIPRLPGKSGEPPRPPKAPLAPRPPAAPPPGASPSPPSGAKPRAA
jgi:uncharacterized protein involved in exopolysaccharide biosynthesis